MAASLRGGFLLVDNSDMCVHSEAMSDETEMSPENYEKLSTAANKMKSIAREMGVSVSGVVALDDGETFDACTFGRLNDVGLFSMAKKMHELGMQIMQEGANPEYMLRAVAKGLTSLNENRKGCEDDE